MKDEKWTSNLNFNIQLFWKLKNHFNSFNPWIIRWSKGDQSVHRKCHSIFILKLEWKRTFLCISISIQIENWKMIKNFQFSISNFCLKIKNWKSIFHWKWNFLYFNFDSKLKIEKRKFSIVLFHFNFKRKTEWHFRCTDYFRSFFNFQFWIEIEIHRNSLFHPNFKMKTEGHLRCTDFVLCYISKISIETKIKALFLISDFNLSKKRNDTSGARIYLFLN